MRQPAGRTTRIASGVVPLCCFLLILLVACSAPRNDSAPPAAQRGSEGVGETRSSVIHDTLGFFSPKVDLHELRFVFFYSGRLFVELSENQEMLLDRLKATYPSFSIEDHGFMADDLSPEHQKFVFQNIPEAVGDKYSVLYLKSLRSEGRTLSGIALYPTGDGGFRGFLGLLKGTMDQGDRIGDRLVVGLAFKSAKKASAKQMHSDEIGQERKSAITKFIHSRLVGTDPRFVRWAGIYVEYPSIQGVATVVELMSARYGRRIKYLFCVIEGQDNPEGLLIVPFKESPGVLGTEERGSLCFEDPGGETDTTPGKSELFILPDLDGDGANELLVVSTVSRLFQMAREMLFDDKTGTHREQYLMKEIRSVYFGP